MRQLVKRTAASFITICRQFLYDNQPSATLQRREFLIHLYHQ